MFGEWLEQLELIATGSRTRETKGAIAPTSLDKRGASPSCINSK